MARPKKKGKPLSLLMDKDLYDGLEEYCRITYLTKTAAIEKAVKLMLLSEKRAQSEISEAGNASEYDENW